MTNTTDTQPQDDTAEASPLYRQVLESSTKLLSPGRPIAMTAIARHAWKRLTEQQRVDSIPQLLVTYIARVQYEAIQREHAKFATDPDVTTYLGDHDMSMLWDALTETDDTQDSITVDRRALLNAVCEIELLNHRLAMASGETEA